MKNKNISIIIPARNEEKSIDKLLKELKKYKKNFKEIIVVDGNSTDKTIKVAKKFNVKIIKQKYKLGYGNAIIKGIKNSKFKYSLVLDGDGSKNPKYIKNLFNKIYNKNADFVFALRYGKNAGSKDDTWLTYLGNRIFTNLGKILFNMKNNDILHTFFICKTKKFNKMKFSFRDFAFCIELPIKVESYNFKTYFMPTIERKRIADKVKVKPFVDGYKILYSMLKMRLFNF